jgi:hypothetical protein
LKGGLPPENTSFSKAIRERRVAFVYYFAYGHKKLWNQAKPPYEKNLWHHYVVSDTERDTFSHGTTHFDEVGWKHDSLSKLQNGSSITETGPNSTRAPAPLPRRGNAVA